MRQKTVLLVLFLTIGQLIVAQNPVDFGRYYRAEEVNTQLRSIHLSHQEQTRLHSLGTSFGGFEVQLLEIGEEAQTNNKTKPAVFVAANIDGQYPIASMGALYLIDQLLTQPARYTDVTWYILPLGHPEGAQHFFAEPLATNTRNTRPFNDDMDDATDEDGCEDLNGDGYITQMRVKDPSGSVLPDTTDARKLRRPDSKKAEKGLYTLYTEGIDNDGDGKYNEDGIGGTNNGVSFPHLFKYHGKTSGLWAGQEEEVYGILQFMHTHHEIAMVMSYGGTNFCLQAPKSGRKGSSSQSSLKVPRRYASMIGADPNQSYTMTQVISMMKAALPGRPVDASTVAGMLGLGPAVNPLPDDLKFYTSYSTDYKKYLKKQGDTLKRVDPKPAQDGSFELWAYYHLGLPVFSQNFWTVPKIETEKDGSTKKDTTAQKAEKKPKAKAKFDGELNFLAYSDSLLDGKGFVEWTEFDHPQLGKVEIGGKVPYADVVPDPKEVESLLSVQVPWVFTLVKDIPRLEIEAHKVKTRGEGLYALEIWIRNTGKLPYPTAMGKRNKVPAPAAVVVSGEELEFLSGRERTVLSGLDGGKNRKLSWLIRVNKGSSIGVEVKAPNAYGDSKTIKMGGK